MATFRDAERSDAGEGARPATRASGCTAAWARAPRPAPLCSPKSHVAARRLCPLHTGWGAERARRNVSDVHPPDACDGGTVVLARDCF